MTHPTFEDCVGLKLACYNFDNFIEFRSLLTSSEVCVWENKWSEYNAFSTNSTIEYVQNVSQQEVFQNLLRSYNELKLNKYDNASLPFTYGMSFEFFNEKNTLLFFNLEKLPDDIYQLIDKDNLEKQNIFLIKTGLIDKEEHVNIIEDVISNLKSDALEDLIKESKTIVCFWFATQSENLTCLTSLQSKHNKASVLFSEEISKKDLKTVIKRLFDSFTFKSN